MLYFGHGGPAGLELRDGRYTATDVLAELDAHGPIFLVAPLLGLEHAFHGLQGGGLITALHLVGSPAVLGALWDVPARASADLAVTLVLAAEQPGDEWAWARGLRQAQLDLLAKPDTADPFFWAGFCLYGLPGP